MRRPCAGLAALALATGGGLAACHAAPDAPGSTNVARPHLASASPTSIASTPGMPDLAGPLPATAPPAASGPSTSAAFVPSTSRDPAVVLAAWKAFVERRDWVAVRAFWGNHGAASGISPADFAARWGQLAAPRVTLGAGDVEGAAGSIYDTVPVTIVDGARTLRGQVVWRRVNDVDGATPEQLRWHIEQSDLAP